MKSPLCSVCVSSGPSYRAAVCPWPPSPWESAVSDRLLTGPSQSWSTSGGGSSSSTGLSLSLSLSGGIQLHCTASISYRSDIFISSTLLRKKRINLKKKKKTTAWTPCHSSLDDTISTTGTGWGGKSEEGCGGSSVSRKTDREGAGTNMLCFPWQRARYLCSVAQQNRAI